MHDKAADMLALIESQVQRYDAPAHRRNFINARAGYLVDTQDWDGHFASIEVDYEGIGPGVVATDQYIQGVRAVKNGDMQGAQNALAKIGGDKPATSSSRRAMVPRLLHLGLAAQIDLAAGRTEQGLEQLNEAVELEASVPPEYGPAVPAQPMAELLGDVHMSLGDRARAKDAYELSLASYVGRERSLQGLANASQAH